MLNGGELMEYDGDKEMLECDLSFVAPQKDLGARSGQVSEAFSSACGERIRAQEIRFARNCRCR